jgi:NAD(P)-dependent dehydrogenase (short-subunit alcohol dehydrogenase family)
MRLQNKVALITGAGGAIGREAALLFAQEGAKIIVTDVVDANGNETVAMIKANGGEAAYIRADVSKESEAKAMIDFAEQTFGKLNILFNNAGISHSQDDDILNTEEKIWDLTLAINVKGVAWGCKHGIPALLRAGGGSIINTASFVALLGAATSQIAYTASKGAVLSMTREIANEFARKGIRANALCPGPVRSPLTDTFLNTEERRQRRLVHIPMGRFGYAKEMAYGALFLASDESSFVNGATFTVDGGITSAYVTPE